MLSEVKGEASTIYLMGSPSLNFKRQKIQRKNGTETKHKYKTKKTKLMATG